MYDFMDEKALRARREHLVNHDRLLTDMEADELELFYQKTCVPDLVKVERDALVQFLPQGRISKTFAIATAQLGIEITNCGAQSFDEDHYRNLIKRLRSLIDVQFAALMKQDVDPIVNRPQLKVPRFLFDAAFSLCDSQSAGRTLTAAIKSCASHQERQELLVSVARQFPGDEFLTEKVLDVVCSDLVPREDRLDICEQLCSAQDYEQFLYAKALIRRREDVLQEPCFSAEVIRYLDLIADHFQFNDVALVPEIQTIANHVMNEESELWGDFDKVEKGRFHLGELEGWTANEPLLALEKRIEVRFRKLWAELKADLNRIPETPFDFDL